MPDWPSLGDPPVFTPCGEDLAYLCVTPADLSTLAEVMISVARWRDAVLTCEGIHVGGVTGTFRPAFKRLGVGPALVRAGEAVTETILAR